MKIRNEDGYITVEAVFVVPIVFFVILAILYFTMYVAEQCKVQAVINQLAVEQALCIKDGMPMGTEKKYGSIAGKGVFFYLKDPGNEKLLNELVREQAESKLTIGTISAIESTLSYQEVEIKVNIKVNVGVSRVKEFFTGTPLEYQLKTKVPVHHSAEFVRGVTAMGETFSDIKGMEAIKEKLGKLLSILGVIA